jgi:hypothetical protein
LFAPRFLMRWQHHRSVNVNSTNKIFRVQSRTKHQIAPTFSDATSNTTSRSLSQQRINWIGFNSKYNILSWMSSLLNEIALFGTLLLGIFCRKERRRWTTAVSRAFFFFSYCWVWFVWAILKRSQWWHQTSTLIQSGKTKNVHERSDNLSFVPHPLFPASTVTSMSIVMHFLSF